MFPTDLAIMTIGHLKTLIDRRVPESASLEYKRDLPRDGSAAWRTNRSLRPAAVTELMCEAIAFANADGGHLVLGIQESASSPHVAAELTPLPQVGLLAEALRDQIRDLIEPPLNGVGVVPIVQSDGGEGYIVIRVPASSSAPHRERRSCQVTIRRANGMQRMDMREIHNLTLQRALSVSERVAKLDAGAHAFHERIRGRSVNGGRYTVGIRVAAMPLVQRPTLERLGTDQMDVPYCGIISAGLNGSRPRPLPWTIYGTSRRTILRGVEAQVQDASTYFSARASRDGFVESQLVSRSGSNVPPARSELALFPDWVVTMAANVMLTAHELRSRAGAPSAEYALRVEVAAEGGELQLAPFGFARLSNERWDLSTHRLQLPDFSLCDLEDMNSLATAIACDLFDAADRAFRGTLALEVPSDLAERWCGMETFPDLPQP